MKANLFFLLLFTGSSAYSQTHLLGIKGGFSFTNANVEPNYGNTPTHRNGFTAGITYEQISEGGFSFLADVLYSERGYKKDYGFTPSNKAGTQLSSGDFNSYTYIAMPLRLGGNFGGPSYCFANVGLVPALLIRAEKHHLIYDGNGALLEKKSTDFSRQANLLDVAGIAEFGVGYKFKTGSRVFGTLSYQQSLTNTNNAGSATGASLKHYGLTIALGFKWALSRNRAAGDGEM